MLLRKSIEIALLLFLITGCGKPEKNAVNSLNKNPVINIGHAGSGFNYLFMPFNPLPPNSFKSLSTALENGATGVEVDIQITADNKLVLFHDKTVDNVVGLSGTVPSVMSTDLIGGKYKIGFPYDLFQDEEVISFKRWIRHAISLPDIPYLQMDIKSSPDQSAESKMKLLELINSELKEVNYPLEKVIAIGVDPALLLMMNKIEPKMNLAFEPGDFQGGLDWAKANNCKYLILDYKKLTGEKIETAHSQGIGIIAFGGKSRSTLVKIINMRPVFIQSNNVALVTELLE